MDYTLLDRLLASLRARRADRLIPPALRGGAILDLGCGVHPAFLERTAFARRVGADRFVPREPPDGIAFVACDLERGGLPFADASFEAVTMLAVVEHLGRARRVPLFDEIHRVLRPGGALVLTTPPPRTDRLHDLLRRARLIGAYMADGHDETFTARDLGEAFARSRFGTGTLRTGTFEMGMNLWATATKPMAIGG